MDNHNDLLLRLLQYEKETGEIKQFQQMQTNTARDNYISFKRSQKPLTHIQKIVQHNIDNSKLKSQTSVDFSQIFNLQKSKYDYTFDKVVKNKSTNRWITMQLTPKKPMANYHTYNNYSRSTTNLEPVQEQKSRTQRTNFNGFFKQNIFSIKQKTPIPTDTQVVFQKVIPMNPYNQNNNTKSLNEFKVTRMKNEQVKTHYPLTNGDLQIMVNGRGKKDSQPLQPIPSPVLKILPVKKKKESKQIQYRPQEGFCEFSGILDDHSVRNDDLQFYVDNKDDFL